MSLDRLNHGLLGLHGIVGVQAQAVPAPVFVMTRDATAPCSAPVPAVKMIGSTKDGAGRRQARDLRTKVDHVASWGLRPHIAA
jgi:hypothetical protein